MTGRLESFVARRSHVYSLSAIQSCSLQIPNARFAHWG